MAGVTARGIPAKQTSAVYFPSHARQSTGARVVVRVGETIYDPFRLSYTGLARAERLDLRVFTRPREFVGEQMGTVKRCPDIVIVPANYQKRS